MKSLRLKGLKYNQGKFYLFNDRFIFFPPQLVDILSSIYGEGVKSLLVWLGKKAGWKLSQNWEEGLKPKTIADLVNQFCTILSNQGWGTFIPKEVSENTIIIELYHNIASELENKSKYFCYFITGLLSGFAEFALYRATVIERKCSLEKKDVNCCEFTLEKLV